MHMSCIFFSNWIHPPAALSRVYLTNFLGSRRDNSPISFSIITQFFNSWNRSLILNKKSSLSDLMILNSTYVPIKVTTEIRFYRWSSPKARLPRWNQGEEIDEKKRNPGYKSRRWVVEVSHSWFNRFRKILVRDEKLNTTYLSLLHLAAAIITYCKVGVI